MGDTFSVRSWGAYGSTLSAFDTVYAGSHLSVTGNGYIQGAASLADQTKFGSTLSVRSWLCTGSSLSATGGVRLFERLSVTNSVHLASDLHVGGLMNSVDANIYLGGYSSGNTLNTAHYIRKTSGADEIKIAAGGDSLTATSSGGQLHGSWSASTFTVTTLIQSSDRRLKTSIAPLARALGRTALDVVNKLRPVSYRFKHGPDAKQIRMGFIAQDVEQVLPAMVKTVANGSKAVLMDDMLALVVSSVQAQDERMDTFEQRLAAVETKLRDIEEQLARRSSFASEVAV
jgi:hypothetical protein